MAATALRRLGGRAAAACATPPLGLAGFAAFVAATACGLASSVLKAATASGSTAPQECSKVATSRRTRSRRVEASALLSSMEMMLARKPCRSVASGEKLA